jgi:GDPmannose 4,6-dehydratase
VGRMKQLHIEKQRTKPVALITGITGQDGSYLAELLLEKGYDVHGIIRRHSAFGTERIDHIMYRLHLHYGDMTDGGGLFRIVNDVLPDEVYNLAAQSHVRVSFDQPDYTAEATGLGTLRLLESIKHCCPWARFYQASSSELYGKSNGVPFDEDSRFYPRSPYAAAKIYAHSIAVNYREAYDLHVSCGILFNHESPRRGETFVTRKITKGLARVVTGKQDYIELGNLWASRDWGYAADYVEAMWLMLQQENPSDYVVATGETHTVAEFLSIAAEKLGLDETKVVRYSDRLIRPSEVDWLCGNPTKANNLLGWKSRTSFTELVSLMVEEDLRKERER